MKRKMLILVLVVLVLTLASCREFSPSGVVETFGSFPQGVSVSATSLEQIQDRNQTQTTGEFSSSTCGELASRFMREAGCYNVGNAGEAPTEGGSCTESLDCSCCFLKGVPPGASEGFLAGLLDAGQEEEVELKAETFVLPPVDPVPIEEVEERQPILPLPKGPILWSVNTGLKVSGGFLLLLIISGVVIEMELVKAMWVPFLGIIYAVFFGVAMAHIWGSLLPMEVPQLIGVWKTAGWVLLLAIAGIGAYLVKSEQVSSKEDKLGYLLLVLTGVGFHYVLNLGRILTILVK